MEVVSKIYKKMGLDEAIKDLNQSFLMDIKKTSYLDKYQSDRVKQIICSLSDAQIEAISAVPVSFCILMNAEFKKGIGADFRPKEINQTVSIKTEALFLMQKMAVNSATLEFAFDADTVSQQYINKMTFKSMKSSAQYSGRIFTTRKGQNPTRWLNLLRILDHPDTTQENLKEQVLLCVK